jgi:hypothetical protein
MHWWEALHTAMAQPSCDVHVAAEKLEHGVGVPVHGPASSDVQPHASHRL